MTQPNPTLQAADALAQAVREASNEDDGCLYVHGHYDGKIQLALRDYERAKQAKPVAADWMRAAASRILEYLSAGRAPEFKYRDYEASGITAIIAKHCPQAPAQDSRDSAITVNELTQWLWDKSKLTDITEEEEQRLDDLRETIEEHLAEMSVDAKEKTAKEIKS